MQQESQSDTNTLESEAVEQIEPDNNCTVGEKLQSPVEQIEEDPASDSAIAKNTDDDVIPIEKKIEEAIVIDENDDEPFNLPLDIKIKQEPIEIEPGKFIVLKNSKYPDILLKNIYFYALQSLKKQ